MTQDGAFRLCPDCGQRAIRTPQEPKGPVCGCQTHARGLAYTCGGDPRNGSGSEPVGMNLPHERSMGHTIRPVPDHLEREEREIQRRLSVLRRQQHQAAVRPDFGEDGSLDFFEAASVASTEQHEEVVRRRLSDKSQALAEALEQVREGTYGLCRACGGRIPPRRLEALPTATLCVTCQERREAA